MGWEIFVYFNNTYPSWIGFWLDSGQYRMYGTLFCDVSGTPTSASSSSSSSAAFLPPKSPITKASDALVVVPCLSAHGRYICMSATHTTPNQGILWQYGRDAYSDSQSMYPSTSINYIVFIALHHVVTIIVKFVFLVLCIAIKGGSRSATGSRLCLFAIDGCAVIYLGLSLLL